VVIAMKSETGEYIKVEGGFLMIRQRISAGKLSTSGKNKVVVSTGGFKPVEGKGDLRVNLTAISKN
jgi:hypothetical protein